MRLITLYNNMRVQLLQVPVHNNIRLCPRGKFYFIFPRALGQKFRLEIAFSNRNRVRRRRVIIFNRQGHLDTTLVYEEINSCE